jgi:hypothetical protein
MQCFGYRARRRTSPTRWRPDAAIAPNWAPNRGAPGPVTVPVHCAKAPKLAEIVIAKAKPAKIQFLRSSATCDVASKSFIPIPQKNKESAQTRHNNEETVNQPHPPRKPNQPALRPCDREFQALYLSGNIEPRADRFDDGWGYRQPASNEWLRDVGHPARARFGLPLVRRRRRLIGDDGAGNAWWRR